MVADEDGEEVEVFSAYPCRRCAEEGIRDTRDID